MIRLILLFILFNLPFTVRAESGDVSYQSAQSMIAGEAQHEQQIQQLCQTLQADPKCQPALDVMKQTLNLSVQTCQQQKQLAQCEAFTQQFPQYKDLQTKCEPGQICRQALSSTFSEGCRKYGIEVGHDLLTTLKKTGACLTRISCAGSEFISAVEFLLSPSRFGQAVSQASKQTFMDMRDDYQKMTHLACLDPETKAQLMCTMAIRYGLATMTTAGLARGGAELIVHMTKLQEDLATTAVRSLVIPPVPGHDKKIAIEKSLVPEDELQIPPVPATALTAKEAEVRRLLDRNFEAASDPLAAVKLDQMDDQLAREISKAAEQMSPLKRQNFLDQISNMKDGQRGMEGQFGKIEGTGDAGAAVTIDPKTGLGLVVDKDMKASPLGRLLVRHEVSHLSRMVSEVTDPKKAAANATAVMQKNRGIYREEILATRDEYRYIRKTHKASELPRLLQNFPPAQPMDLSILRSKGIVSTQNGQSVIDYQKGLSIDPVTLHRYLIGKSNELYADLVGQAFTMNESAFVKFEAGRDGYRAQQKLLANDQIKAQIKSYFLYGASGAAVGGAAAGLGAAAIGHSESP